MSEETRPASDSQIPGQNTADGWTEKDRAMIDDLFSKPIRRNPPPFQPYPDDVAKAGTCRIRDVLNLKETASNVIYEAGPEQRAEWLSWIQSLVTNTPMRQFSDLFPPYSIFEYRDIHDKRLPGLRAIIEDHTDPKEWEELIKRARERGRFQISAPLIYWQYIDPDDPTLTSYEQENFLRLSALPTAAFALASAFESDSAALQRINDELEAEVLELKRQNRELQQRCAKLASNLDPSRTDHNGI